jgi:hypothetical protein
MRMVDDTVPKKRSVPKMSLTAHDLCVLTATSIPADAAGRQQMAEQLAAFRVRRAREVPAAAEPLSTNSTESSHNTLFLHQRSQIEKVGLRAAHKRIAENRPFRSDDSHLMLR